jgi:hypothetical protein
MIGAGVMAEIIENNGSEDASGSITDMLDGLGLSEGHWFETIVTTNGPHKNAAAIGIRRVKNKLQMMIFEMSNTFENIQKGKEEQDHYRFAVNMISPSQIDLLCNAALRGWGSPIPEFPDEFYSDLGDTPVLKSARAWIICEPEEHHIEDVKDSWGKSSRMVLIAEIKDVVLNEADEFKPIKRGPEEPLVDALVYATKFKIAKGSMKDKCRSEVENLLDLAGNPSDDAHRETMEALKEFFGIID